MQAYSNITFFQKNYIKTFNLIYKNIDYYVK